ncbi:MAG TPA: hypothetical protein PKV72_01675 [Candidatus Peribacteria bacterium]|nr:hypothetical protein [Candidatus Peribacteria bacterium]
MLHMVTNGATLSEAATDADIIAMGINPSKSQLHQGHYLTLYQAAAATLARRDRRAIAFVDDREYHFNGASVRPGESARYPKTAVVLEVQRLMHDFIQRLADQLGEHSLPDRIAVKRMSDHMAESFDGVSQGGELYALLADQRRLLEEAFEFNQNDSGKRHMVRPVCPSCEYGPTSEELIGMERGRIRSDCQRATCRYGEYSVRVADGESNWGMHYAIDPLRDIFIAKHADARVLHVFGGDYGVSWGRSFMPKAQRLSLLADMIGEGARVDHFVGPMLIRNGEKLAKSHGHASEPLSVKELQELLDGNRPYIEV